MRTELLVATALLAAPAWAQTCPSRDHWPTDEWPVNLVDPTAKAAQLKALEDYLFTWQEPDSARRGLRTEGLVIIKHGVLVYERYARGFDATRRHLSWSVAKSVSSTLVGVAVQQGALRLDDSICKYLREYQGAVCDITVRDPIAFTTGLRWQEGYEDESYQTSSVIAMLYGVGHRDHLRHILTHDLERPPGTWWRYSTGDAEVAAAVAKRALAPRFGADAFWSLLFDKVGMRSTVLEEDALGTPLGGSMVYATPRDYARLGYLMLNDGCWAGERLLPEGWVKAATTPTTQFLATAPQGETVPAGYSWWLNRPVPELKDAAGRVLRRASTKPWADAPDDTFGANGHWGQYVWVVPSQDLVVVRTGDDRTAGLNQGRAISLALEVAR
jgi:CubicO group peptidase (beta-lactamase class C family)